MENHHLSRTVHARSQSKVIVPEDNPIPCQRHVWNHTQMHCGLIVTRAAVQTDHKRPWIPDWSRPFSGGSCLTASRTGSADCCVHALTVPSSYQLSYAYIRSRWCPLVKSESSSSHHVTMHELPLERYFSPNWSAAERVCTVTCFDLLEVERPARKYFPFSLFPLYASLP